LFYHNGALPGGGGFTRSVCVDEVVFNADGSIPRVIPSADAITIPVGAINPFTRVEAETIAWEAGIETKEGASTGVYVTDISNGDYIKVRNVDFKKAPKSFQANVNALSGNGSIEIHIDGLTGPLLGTLTVTKQDGWQIQSTKVAKVKGNHDVYFVFKGDGDLFNFDWWKFR
jgi:hypothetical protein